MNFIKKEHLNKELAKIPYIFHKKVFNMQELLVSDEISGKTQDWVKIKA